MKISHLALVVLSAFPLLTKNDAFVVTPTRSFDKNRNEILKRLQSVVAEASPTTTQLFMFENIENYESFISDTTESIDESIIPNDEISSSSLTVAETAQPGAQAAGGQALSAAVATQGLSAGAAVSTVAFGGLAVARAALAQRQKKLDEEKFDLEEKQKRIEEQQRRLETESTQSNVLLVSQSFA